MRLLICTDRLGALASSDAGAALGRAFVAVRPGVEVAVVPLAAGGDDLRQALAELGDDAVVVTGPAADAPEPGIDTQSSTLALGRDLAAVLADGPRRVVVDLTSVRTHDGGAGLLAALGARADVPLDAGVGGLSGLTHVDLDTARALVIAAVHGASKRAAALGALRGGFINGLICDAATARWLLDQPLRRAGAPSSP